jgi:hypothetical protein
VSYIQDFFLRLRRSRWWIAIQFVGTPLLLVAGLAWTQIPDRHWWQVALTLAIPLVLVISILEVEAGTMRALADDDGMRVKLVWGACTVLVWAGLFWACWAALDWCDDQIPAWAGYLDSKASASERATTLTYAHIAHWLSVIEWILRWIIVPGKIIPYSVVSAQWGWRIPFRRVFRLLLGWRWWPAVVAAALVGVSLPAHFFSTIPHGTVSAQVSAVAWKLVATYVLVIGGWVLLLAWAAVLLDRIASDAEEDGDALGEPVIVGSGPLGEDAVRLPPPEEGESV